MMLWGGCKAGVTTVRFQPNHPPTKHGHTDPTLNKEVGPVDRGRVMEDNDCSGSRSENRRCQGSPIPTLLKRSRGGPTSAHATTLPLLSAGLPVYRRQVGLDETSKTS